MKTFPDLKKIRKTPTRKKIKKQTNFDQFSVSEEVGRLLKVLVNIIYFNVSTAQVPTTWRQ